MLKIVALIALLSVSSCNAATPCITGQKILNMNVPPTAGLEITSDSCGDFTNTCFTLDYSMSMFGVSVTAVQGVCGVKTTCDSMCKLVQANLPSNAKMQSCNCCDTPECNKEKLGQYKKVVIDSVTCITGQKMEGSSNVMTPGLEIKTDTCSGGTNRCYTLEYGMNVLGQSMKATQGVCGSSLDTCDNMCKRIRQSAPSISECNCCHTEECNKEKLKNALEGTKKVSVAVENEGVECVTGLKGRSPKTVKCSSDSPKCVTLDYDMNLFGLQMNVVQGRCSNVASTCEMNCRVVKSTIKNVDRCNCCEDAKCNKEKFSA